jgi:hypothetical protein
MPSSRGGDTMRTMERVKSFNEKVAQVVNDATGNMWFFWASLGFILFLRLSHPPAAREFLLDVENDLQLLLLAANAVVAQKQLGLVVQILDQIKSKEDEIEGKVERTSVGKGVA